MKFLILLLLVSCGPPISKPDAGSMPDAGVDAFVWPTGLGTNEEPAVLIPVDATPSLPYDAR